MGIDFGMNVYTKEQIRKMLAKTKKEIDVQLKVS